jgi:hypothetical protein
MARNDTRRFRTDPADRAPPRARADSPADSWRALANVTVASALVVAVVVAILALLESVFSGSASKLARRAPGSLELRSWHARTQRPDDFSTAPTQGQPALLVTD